MSSTSKDQILYGCTVRIKHVQTGRYLSSPQKPYSHPRGTNQTQVTASNEPTPAGLWIVRSQHGNAPEDRKGLPVLDNVVLRLQHRKSREMLHSHKDGKSPVTEKQEVTTYKHPTTGAGDPNDNWGVLCDAPELLKNARIRLTHANTSAKLCSIEGKSHPDYTSEEQEVCGETNVDLNNENCLWEIAEVLPPRHSIQEQIDKVVDLVGQLPSDDTSTPRLLEKNLDATEYFRTNKLRLVLTKVVSYLQRFSEERYTKVFEDYPPVTLEKIQRALAGLEGNVDTIRKRCVAANNNQPQRLGEVDLSNAIRQTGEWYDQLFQILPKTSADPEKLRATVDSAQETKALIDDAVTRLKTAASSTAVHLQISENLQEIEDAKTSHRRWAIAWMVCTIIFFIICMGVDFYLFHDPSELPYGWDAISYFLRRIILLSLFVWPTFVSLKLYKIHQHNHVLNRQREIAFRGFGKMLEVTQGDAPAQKEMVAQACKTIFEQENTGFLESGKLDKPSGELLGNLIGHLVNATKK